MKFLNLNTGYSFDGLWQNYIGWENWKIEKRPVFDDMNTVIRKYNNFKDTDDFQI